MIFQEGELFGKPFGKRDVISVHPCDKDALRLLQGVPRLYALSLLKVVQRLYALSLLQGVQRLYALSLLQGVLRLYALSLLKVVQRLYALSLSKGTMRLLILQRPFFFVILRRPHGRRRISCLFGILQLLRSFRMRMREG